MNPEIGQLIRIRITDERADSPVDNSMPSDQSILNGLRERNPDACKWLVDRFEDPLFRFFVCKHRDYHLAQEQTAETFAQLIRSLPGMSGSQEQLHGFVFSVARHVQLRHWRRPKVTGCDPEMAECVADPRPSSATQLAVAYC